MGRGQAAAASSPNSLREGDTSRANLSRVLGSSESRHTRAKRTGDTAAGLSVAQKLERVFRVGAGNARDRGRATAPRGVRAQLVGGLGGALGRERRAALRWGRQRERHGGRVAIVEKAAFGAEWDGGDGRRWKRLQTDAGGPVGERVAV